MIVQYKANTADQAILDDITNLIRDSLEEWYGAGGRLETATPEIHSYRNSFILRYPVVTPGEQKKTILVKIRRNPKMDSLLQAIHADIHQNIPIEYHSLEFVHKQLAPLDEHFAAIRPLRYIEKYSAIIMEEFPSSTLRQLLIDQRSSKSAASMNTLRDAARKTGRWLYAFHHHVHIPTWMPHTVDDILKEVRSYGDRIETCSHGRVRSQALVDAFARKLERVHIDSAMYSQSHADMTCDNVLYSDDKRLCVIDIKTRLAPIYADLGLILVHPETSKPQIFSGGTYYPETLLRVYRDEIVAGYFEEKPSDEVLVRVYSAVKVLDKWLMYEELISRYKGLKHLLAFPVAPFVTAYFQSLLKKHLELIHPHETGQAVAMSNTADHSA